MRFILGIAFSLIVAGAAPAQSPMSFTIKSCTDCHVSNKSCPNHVRWSQRAVRRSV